MKGHSSSRAPVLLLLAAVIVANFMACGDRDLSRERALKILNEHESQLLVAGGANDPEVATEPIDVLFVGATPAELAGTEPLRMDDLATYENILKKAGTIGPITTSTAVTLYRDQLFLEALRKSGIVRRTGLRNTTTSLGLYGGPDTAVNALELSYDRGEASDVQLVWGNRDIYHRRSATVRPLTLHVTAVTGVTGKDDMRTVEATVTPHESASLARLREIAREVLRSEGTNEADYVRTCTRQRSDFVCNVLFFNVPSPATQSFFFQRFDDGWRVTGVHP